MKSYPIIAAIFATVICTIFFLVSPSPKPAGDICEYYGITETLKNNGTIALGQSDRSKLEKTLGQKYYDLWYCYKEGVNGKRYPIHFVGYSLAAFPVRLALEILGIDPLKTFAVTNALFLGAMLVLILKTLPLSVPLQWSLILFTFLSPLMSFIPWPGPDLAAIALLLYGLLALLYDKPRAALVALAFASWQSQPLLVVVAGIGFWMLLHDHKWSKLIAPGLIALLPFAYNLAVFGVLTPWQNLTDGWTRAYGFGPHNISFHKLWEQLFDLNIGVFWYAPLVTLYGLYALVTRAFTMKKWMLLSLLALGCAFAFQTNPAWHYGTSGFGPSRHAITLYAFLIVGALSHVTHKPFRVALPITVLVSQLFVLSVNNYLAPTFTNTLHHSPYATLVLNHWPHWYTPTPEIFVDRTNHTDEDHITRALYTYQNTCRKAYIQVTDIDWLTDQCGPLPEDIQATIKNTQTDGFYVNYAP